MAFGDFVAVCQQAALPLCSLIGSSGLAADAGIQPKCYARTIELANTIIFQGAASFVHIIALIMTLIMIFHVRSKFTAVGRKEITTFFYIYLVLTIISLVIDSGVVPPGTAPLPYFVAVQIGLASALCISLFINGFLGFQVYEDGTPLSVWLLRLSSLAWFVIVFLVALFTFQGLAGLGPEKTVGLFVVQYIVNGLLLLVYVVMQIILVTRTLQDRWPLGDIIFGVFFFVIGQVILYALGSHICSVAQHYLDGLFFATVCNLLAVMMVYKYWDSITTEDLEFSVGTKTGNWDVKDYAPVDADPYASGRTSAFYAQGETAHSRPSPHAQGNDQTFSAFPDHLAALLTHALPALTIHTAVYPSFETRGDLPSTVTRFREWLLNAVIDREVARGTPSPTVAPGVKTLLVGHSMGGIVAAEAALGIARDGPGDPRAATLFPAVQGVLAFDTPYLGIAPSVVARGAEDQWAAGKAWYDSAAGAWAQTPWGKADAAAAAGSGGAKAAQAAQAAKAAQGATAANATQAAGAWGWGKFALVAGAAGAVAAGTGAAAYLGRETLSSGWSWVGSHLEFVGCLARGEELRQRLEAVRALGASHDMGFANLYTLLGRNAGALPGESKKSLAARVLGEDRTFCNVPKSTDAKQAWHIAKNEKAGNEIEAHMYMFSPTENPGYYAMGELAKGLAVKWVEAGWKEMDEPLEGSTKSEPIDLT
ncbi:hypothetical protein FH972_024669 [Carpinus fangiana]|uniref:Chitin synthase export chaperone n=1 Tax=Carpinus fangiana TaxID=176857 RepID=A0A5N6KZK2_9ROSI|nr:hypothetical protein FH972_024669 [Carpinus fangiana]